MNEEPEINPERPIFKRSAETQAIAKLLASTEVNKTVTYEELILAGGGNPAEGLTPSIRSKIYSAEKILLNEKQMVFHVITGVGLQRSHGTDVVDGSRRKVTHLRRKTKKISKELATVKIAELPSDKKQTAYLIQAQVGAVRLSLSVPSEHLIIQKLEQGKRLEIGNVMDLFKEQK